LKALVGKIGLLFQAKFADCTDGAYFRQRPDKNSFTPLAYLL